MIKQHPHSASITIRTEVDNGGAFSEYNEEVISLQGRYETQGGDNTLDYSAKFYCGRIEILETDRNALDGEKLSFEGRLIGIARAVNYQTHAELWLD